MSDGKKEFVSDVGTNEGQSVDVSQSGSVDVSDRSTRDLGSVDVANQPLGIDDSTPIAVDESLPSAEFVSLANKQTVSAGSQNNWTVSVPAGEEWEVVNYHIRAKNDTASSGSGSYTAYMSWQDSADYSPYGFFDRVSVNATYTYNLSASMRYFDDGSGNPVSPSNATTVAPPNLMSPVGTVVTEDHTINAKLLNNTDGSVEFGAYIVIRRRQM